MNNINAIEKSISPLRNRLQSHPLYTSIKGIEDVKVFMENHVFAVWDFMSLLKSLQNHLTCTSVPWLPGQNPILARFINEIVHGEESDINELGVPNSHYQMYIDAMDEVGASKIKLESFISQLVSGDTPKKAIENCEVKTAVKEFLAHTFGVINTNSPHKIASSFTFGREDIIPDMFIEVIKNAEERNQKSLYPKLSYYLERHIEVDSGEHGPISLQMVEELCGDSTLKWEEAHATAIESLEVRIKLWDSIYDQIKANQTIIDAVMTELI